MRIFVGFCVSLIFAASCNFYQAVEARPLDRPSNTGTGRYSVQTSAVSSDGVWRILDETAQRLLSERQVQRPIVPQAFRAYELDMDALRLLLSKAPMEFTEAARNNQIVMTVPMPDGTFARFHIELSPIVEAGLAAKFPELGQTYRAQGIDDPTATMRFDLLPSGFHAMILSTGDTVFIDPYATDDTRNYISYYKHDLVRPNITFKCEFVSPDGEIRADASKLNAEPEVINGSTLRTYRLALAATREYTTAVGGGTVAGALAAQVLIMNRVNGVYEKDLAIHMNIIANNNLIIYTAEPDPYTNNNGSTMLAQNQTNLTAVIGAANYDIGHVFSTGGGGVATLNSPCSAANKARGVTGLPSPVGDAFAIDYVAHEMGHQFGANHTFNGTTSNCGGGNRSAGAAVEPGSGITIMAYAGICGAQDLAAHSIDTMSVRSLEEIVVFREAGGTCGPATATGNTPPTPTGPGNFTIPRTTPFALTASATDPNGDSLTYSWEEYDFGASSPPDTDADGQPRPIFRPYLPVTGGTRFFPSLQFILNNANVPPGTTGGFLTGEILPSIARTMTFKVVVRDNRANGGGINTATSVVTVSATTGPFNVTVPNTAVTWTGNTAQTVTWNVAGTSGAPVNAANVKISLSTNGGNTFPTTILASTPNDGTQSLVVPNISTASARIKVEAVGNIFFDTSDVNFTINAPTAAPADIGGRVTNPNGAPLPGVTLALLDVRNSTTITTTSMADGRYIFPAALTGNDYIVTPSRFGFSFNPGSQYFAHIGVRTNVDFAATSNTALSRAISNDFDGDGRTDMVVFRPSESTWYILQSQTETLRSVKWGAEGDQLVPSDFDGDGKTDIAVFRPSNGSWFILNSHDGSSSYVAFGMNGDIPVPAYYDNDDNADVAVFRQSTGTWFVLNSSDESIRAQSWGTSADRPVIADYDGDSVADPSVFRPGNQTWYILLSSTNTSRATAFGIATDVLAPCDFDGDGKADLAVYRAGLWYLARSTDGVAYNVAFGGQTDVPVPGDYDGDGMTDFGIFRSIDGTWYLLESLSGQLRARQWGMSGDVPVNPIDVR